MLCSLISSPWPGKLTLKSLGFFSGSVVNTPAGDWENYSKPERSTYYKIKMFRVFSPRLNSELLCTDLLELVCNFTERHRKKRALNQNYSVTHQVLQLLCLQAVSELIVNALLPRKTETHLVWVGQQKSREYWLQPQWKCSVNTSPECCICLSAWLTVIHQVFNSGQTNNQEKEKYH